METIHLWYRYDEREREMMLRARERVSSVMERNSLHCILSKYWDRLTRPDPLPCLIKTIYSQSVVSGAWQWGEMQRELVQCSDFCKSLIRYVMYSCYQMLSVKSCAFMNPLRFGWVTTCKETMVFLCLVINSCQYPRHRQTQQLYLHQTNCSLMSLSQKHCYWLQRMCKWYREMSHKIHGENPLDLTE